MLEKQRQDFDLAPMLRYENIAWYEDGKVRILDRRVYPKEEYVYCNSHIEVAKAIKDMVTQSAGPFTAAPMGLALAAFECKDKSKEEQIEYLKNAATVLYSARPTTKMRMKILVENALSKALLAIEEGRDASEAIVSSVVDMNNQRYFEIDRIAKHLTKKMENGSKVLTYCFAETILGMLGRNLKEQGKDVSFYCCETRPYFQGSRLTASCLFDMGFDVTVITDGMPSSVMRNVGIDIFTTAADAICCDGSVINKVGTSNTAIVAKHYGVPYYVTGAPEYGHASAKDVVIEQRDATETLMALGNRTAKEGIKGYYPAFDVTDPEFVTGIATPEGIFTPDELGKYFDIAGRQFKVIV